MPLNPELPRERLGQAVEARIDHLGLNFNEVARASGFSSETLAKIRRGEKVAARTLRRLEPALGWATYAADEVLAGGVAGIAPTASSADTDSTDADADAVAFTDPVEQEIWSMQSLGIAEKIDHIAAHRTRRARDEAAAEISELRRELAQAKRQLRDAQ